jgi:hypothetical protein
MDAPMDAAAPAPSGRWRLGSARRRPAWRREPRRRRSRHPGGLLAEPPAGADQPRCGESRRSPAGHPARARAGTARFGSGGRPPRRPHPPAPDGSASTLADIAVSRATLSVSAVSRASRAQLSLAATAAGTPIALGATSASPRIDPKPESGRGPRGNPIHSLRGGGYRSDGPTSRRSPTGPCGMG